MDAAKANPPDVERLIDEVIADEAPQAILRSCDTPIVALDELLAALKGPALQLVLDARVEQIAKHGHDREHDEMLAIDRLPRLAREMAGMANDLLGHDERRNLPVARRRLARCAALCMAAIDRIDMVKGVEG